MSNPSVLLTVEFFANPSCPPGPSAVASTLDPIAVSGEDRSKNSSAAAGEEVVLPMDQEETILPTDQEETVLLTDQEKAILPMDQEKVILPTDLPTKYNLSSLLRRDLFCLLHQTIYFSFLLWLFWMFWHCTIRIYAYFLFNVSFEYI